MTSPDRVLLIPLLPLLGFVLAGLFGRRLGKTAVSILCCGTMVTAFAISVSLFFGRVESALTVVAFDWFQAGSLTVRAAFLVDPLSLVMLLVITGIGSLIHIYSIGYMHHDPGYHRYFAYLNLFVFFMLVLVLAESLPLMFVGWEGVGLCSYLLIGFWYQKPSAADAGLKAFLVNRVGDFGFVLAMLAAFATFGTLSFSAISELAPVASAAYGTAPLRLIAFLLFFAATGKSAQLPLYIWLPDAMEGPTPVSALIHAATMVTSGIYMVARLHTLFALVPDVLWLVGIVGAATACFAATMGITATDIKKVLAYSTISQLGYMFLGLGVGATAAGMFHLVTHAFFKACLFLGAGAVMHALGNETDLRKMGGLARRIPLTALAMGAATLAIVGFPGTSGFVSKDGILAAALEARAWPILGLGVFTVFLTSFYMFRLFFLAFLGEPRMDHATFDHAHDATPSMATALVPLGVLSLVGGLLNWPKMLGGSERFSHFLAPVLALPEGVPLLHAEHPHLSAAVEHGFSLALLATTALGFGLAWALYRKPSQASARIAAGLGPVARLVQHRWYADELVFALVVGPVVAGSRWVWRWIDEIVIDGTVNLIGIGTQVVGEVVRFAHSGATRTYALYIALGVAGILLTVIVAQVGL